MSKLVDEAYELLEKMSSNNHQWHSERIVPRRPAGVNEVEAISTISA